MGRSARDADCQRLGKSNPVGPEIAGEPSRLDYPQVMFGQGGDDPETQDSRRLGDQGSFQDYRPDEGYCHHHTL